MANQSLARYVNELSILTLLRTHGPMSRADMARKLSLTPATITRLISKLSAGGLVKKSDLPDMTTREPGRPGTSVALNPRGGFFLGIEIGVGILRYILLDLSGAVAASAEETVSRHVTPEEAVKVIAGYVSQLKRNAIYRGKIRSAVVTVPGLVTSEGFVVYLPILGWKNVNLLEMLSKKIGLSCLVENNANAAAFGSVYTQPSLPNISTIFLKLGTGCGGAAIINGRLLRGSTGTAGELGHIRITEDGHPCSCGQSGCLESWVNLGALARSFRGTDKLTAAQYARLPAEVIAKADMGDAAAIAAIDSLSHYLSLGIVTIVNIFNPTTVVIGGVMAPILKRRLRAIQSTIADGAVPGTRVPQVQLSPLGTLECAIGAASIAHHHAFDLSRLNLHEQELPA
jgi:predicted NBD/HSP70 family sugar kinase